MIEIQAKIHDKFSVEFKVGFITRKRLAVSDFVMNTWIFIPHSLDINLKTYDKTRFYRDIKSNVRLVTPVYLLRDLATTDTLPFQELEKSFRQLSSTPTRTATAGIGTNMYMAKVAMDVVAKHIPADKDGVRIAELDEMSYRQKLWTHRPLTDFWRVGKGIADKLGQYGIYTMGDIARQSERNEELPR